MMLTGDDFLAGLYDGIQLLLVNTFGVDLVVGDGSAPLGVGKPLDEIGVTVHGNIADLEVFETTGGLHAVEGVGGNFERSQQVGFFSHFGRFNSHFLVFICCYYYLRVEPG